MYCILLFWLQLVKYIYIFTDQLNSISLCLKLCIHWDLDLTEALARPSLTNPNDNFLTTVYFIIYEMTSSNNKRHKKKSTLLKYPTKEIIHVHLLNWLEVNVVQNRKAKLFLSFNFLEIFYISLFGMKSQN